ncbi:hypothetical protein F0L17_23535 [Streptomyces sp. TRM43335]|uniref:Uncharacterized protein n=1 Tax=Streptomyces taklimakanensis TaxID=2569853 RepID=A0A6G2BIC1_9ACTN|nr:hypothetical protein [Streptomyces taklimakanensis]MTE22031.1 hypothetical protein [Streptomyces taklimakanensis]
MPSEITARHVRELLDSPDPDPRLILLEGRARVVPAAQMGTDRYRGAVEVISRDALTARLDDGDPAERDPDTLAARLQAVVDGMGA